MNYSFRYFAEKDLQSAQLLMQHNANFNVAASLMQQALEKMIKYILVLKNQEAPRTHSLLALYSEAFPDKIKKNRARLREIGSMYFTMRYPNDDYYELDEEEIRRLWSLFIDLYREIEAVADELEQHVATDKVTHLF